MDGWVDGLMELSLADEQVGLCVTTLYTPPLRIRSYRNRMLEIVNYFEGSAAFDDDCLPEVRVAHLA